MIKAQGSSQARASQSSLTKPSSTPAWGDRVGLQSSRSSSSSLLSYSKGDLPSQRWSARNSGVLVDSVSPDESADEQHIDESSKISAIRDAVSHLDEDVRQTLFGQTSDSMMRILPAAAGQDVNDFQEEPIIAGSILVCIYRGDHGAADVWQDVRVPRVISMVRHANCIMAAGPPLEVRKGFFLIPILPFGAVEADCFQHVKIAKGTKLVCASREAEVWASMESATIKGVLSFGTVVVARGPPRLDADMVMVPIEPRGAVDLDQFAYLRVYLNGFLPSRDGRNPSFLKLYYDLDSNRTLERNLESGEEDAEQRSQPQKHSESRAPRQMQVDTGMQWISSGDALVCIVEEGANVHVSCASKDVTGLVLSGEHVIARGRPLDFEGSSWIPVRPDGYVKLDFFRMVSRDDVRDVERSTLASPGSNRILFGLSRWASGICGTLGNTLEYVLGKCHLMKPLISQSIDANLGRFGKLSKTICEFPETNRARSFGRELACSWMMESDAGFKSMLHPIPNLDITVIRVFLTYFEWAVRLRADITADIIWQMWLMFSGGSTSRRFTAQQDQSLLLSLLGMHGVEKPVGRRTMHNLAELMKGLEEFLNEDEDTARNRLVSELISRLEAFYGSVADGIRAMVGQQSSGLSIHDFTAHLGFLRVSPRIDYVPLATELFHILDMDKDGLISINDWIEAFSIMRDPENSAAIEDTKQQLERIAGRSAKVKVGPSSLDERRRKAESDEERRKAGKERQDAVLHAFGFGDDDEDDGDDERSQTVRRNVQKRGNNKRQPAIAEPKREIKRRPSLRAAVSAEKERKIRMETEQQQKIADDRRDDHENISQPPIDPADTSGGDQLSNNKVEASSGDEDSTSNSPEELHRRMIVKLLEANSGEGGLSAMSSEERRLAEHQAERKLCINGNWTHDRRLIIVSGMKARFASGEVCDVHCVGAKTYQCVVNGLTLKGKLNDDSRSLVWKRQSQSIVWDRDFREGSLKKLKLYLNVRIKESHPEKFWQKFDPKCAGLLTLDMVKRILREELQISRKDISDEDVDAVLRPLDCNGISIHDLVKFMHIGVAGITNFDAEKAHGDTKDRLKAWRRDHDDGVDPKLKQMGLNKKTSKLFQSRLKAATFGSKAEEFAKRYDDENLHTVDIESFVHFIRATLKIPAHDISDRSIVKLYVGLGTNDNNDLDLEKFVLLVKFGIDFILADAPEKLDALKERTKAMASAEKNKFDRAAAASDARRRSRVEFQELSNSDVSLWLKAKKQLKKQCDDSGVYGLFLTHQGHHPSEWKRDHKKRDEIRMLLNEHGVAFQESALDRLLACLDPNVTGEISIRQLAEFLEHPTKTPAKMLAAHGLPIVIGGKLEANRNPFAGKRGVVHFRKRLLDRAQAFPAGVEAFLKQYDQKKSGFLEVSEMRALMYSLSSSSAPSSSGNPPASSQFSKADARDLATAIGGKAEGISVNDLVAFVNIPTFLMSDRSSGPSPKKAERKDFRTWRPPASLSDNRWLPRVTPSAAVEAALRMKAAKAASPPPPQMNVEGHKHKHSFVVPRRFDYDKKSRSPQQTFSFAGAHPVKRRPASAVSPRKVLAEQASQPQVWHERLFKETTNSWDHRFVPGYQSSANDRKKHDDAAIRARGGSGNPMMRQNAATAAKR